MPTVSEPIWPLQDDRTKVIVDDFVNDIGGIVVSSVAVFEARLFANGLRGQELNTISRLAQMKKLDRQPRRKEATNVMVMERGGETNIIRFTNGDTATFACRLLRKQHNVICAYVVRAYEPHPVVDITTNRFVDDMLRLL